MTNNIFQTARNSINSGIIESVVLQIDASVKLNGSQYLLLCPFHQDTSPSLSIHAETGLFKCFGCGEGGDFIDLISRINTISKKEAAEKIIQMSGQLLPEKHKKEQKKKIDAIIPIPKEAFQKLNNRLKSEWSINKYGEAVHGWTYKDQHENPLFVTVRHEKDRKKIVKPYFCGKDEKWHAGNPYNKNIPLYGLWRLSDCPVLIVEGEKCADIEVEGYSVLTWLGGPNQVYKADWRSLQGKKIIIWPDNDKQIDKKTGELNPDGKQPGLFAAIQIKKILPQAKILKIEDKPSKWDIYDASQEGLNLVEFIENCEEYVTLDEQDLPEISQDIDISDNIHFRFMGFDDAFHYFLTRGSRTIKKISQGGFSKAKLLEIAPLSFYYMEFNQRQGFCMDSAIDWLIRNSESQGFYKPESVRGTGVWIDEEKIIINNGDYIVNGSGERIKNFNTKFFYVKSDRKMGKLSGNISTDEQGKKLIELFQAQGFENKIESWIVCGWTLIAPFAGILKWRPHIWITGPTQSGKSFLLREIIHPLCGPISEIGTGKTSAPGIYRALKNSAAPVILDEMEPGKNKESRMRIEEKLEIARNSSSDFSANMSLASKNGGVDRFCIRSPFCFSSIIPFFMSEAIENRILICRLKNFRNVKDKRKNTREIFQSGLLNDPGIFRRRIYQNLKLLIKNSDIIRNIIIQETSDNRKADNLSSIIAALFLIFDITDFSTKDIKPMVMEILENAEQETLETDEDKLITFILDYQIRMISGEYISVAELMIENKDFPSEEKENLLLRNGMKIFSEKKFKYVAFAKNHSGLNKILENTQYQGRYVDILKRHPMYMNDDRSIRFAGQTRTAILLDWNKIEERYFNDQDDQTMEIPF